jgi:hypothetical protein
MVAEDFKTLREVGIAIEGIKHRLNLMTGVFAVSVLIGVGALGYAANRVNTVAEDTHEIKGRLDGIDKRLDTLTTLVSNLQPSKRQGRLEAPQPIPFDYAPQN